MATDCSKKIVPEDGDGGHEESDENDNVDAPDKPIIRRDSDFELKVGMIAYSEQEAYDMYNTYAYNKGFSIRKGQKGCKRSTGEYNRRVFLCSKEGYREFSNPYEEKKINRIDSRCGCPARVIFKVENGVYEIIRIVSEHNHPFVEPTQKHLMRSARKFHDASGGVSKFLANDGIRAMKTDSYLAKEACGSQNLEFTKKDCHNYIQADEKKKIAAEDGQSVLSYFKHKQAEDPMFFYKVQADDDNRMSNLFWSDSLSRADYECFGDVVIFDSTFRTNKYNMICAPFVGVNHHWKNIFFGCAFLLEETIASFVWLFDAFLQLMGNKAPKTIFTDEDQAMTDAIAQVFPDTQHCLCQWHISKNAAQNISRLYHQPGFRDKFNNLLYNCETESEFEATWNEMIDEWGASDETWLHRLYTLRGKWAPALNREIFSANIRSIQRSESTNNIFQQMVCKTMTLIEFVLHYEENVNKMREAELKEDFNCAQGKPHILIPNSRILKHASNVYTHKIFGMFQDEFLQGVAEEVTKINIDGTFHTYNLRREGGYREHIVQFDSSDCSIICSCKKFESRGWLCSHALRVLNMQTGVQKIPDQYILKRWTKGAKEGIVLDKIGHSLQNSVNSSKTVRLNRLMQKAFDVMNFSADDDTTAEIAEANLERLLKKVKKYKATLNRTDDSNLDEADGDAVSDASVLDPPRRRPKGVTYGKLKGSLEKKKKKASKTAPSTSDAHAAPPHNVTPGPSPVIGYASHAQAPQTHSIVPSPSQMTGYASHAHAPQSHNVVLGPSQVISYASHAHAPQPHNVMPGPSHAPIFSMYGYRNVPFTDLSQTNISSRGSSHSVMGTYISPHFPHLSQDGGSNRSKELCDDKK